MILTTGGRASGATSTRSRPRCCAAASASSTVITPSCSPSGAITRSGLIRICRFTRVRGALFVLSIARCGSPPRARQNKKRAAPAYPIVGTKLAAPERVHKCERLALAAQPSRHHLGIVLEAEQPPLRFGLLVQMALRLERHEGLEVISHDPGEREVGRGRDQVRDEAGPLAAALEQDRLVIRHVAGGGETANPRERLRWAVHERERHGVEVGCEVARRR